MRKSPPWRRSAFRCACAIVLAASLQAEEIVIGMSAAFEGPSRGVGIELWRGSAAYFEHVNRNGGLYGRKIRVLAYNDDYDPNAALRNTSKLIEKDGAFLLFGYMGTPTVTRVLPLLKIHEEYNYLLFFPLTGSETPRLPPYGRFVFHMRPSYAQETEGLIERFLAAGRTRIGVFYQNDSYGRSGWEGVRKALARRKMLVEAEAAYLRGSPFETDFRPHVEIFRKAQVDAIVSVGAYAACAALIRDARDAGLNVPIANVSFVGSEYLLETLVAEGKRKGKDYTADLITSQVVPSYEETHLPGVAEYRKRIDQYDPRPGFTRLEKGLVRYSFTSLEGYLDAKLLVEILRRVGPSLDRLKIREAVESIHSFDLGIGELATFGPNKRQALTRVYFTTVEKGRFVSIRSWERWKK
jgi:branched-chain amino acid transport system substrate-binding protein